MPAPKTPNTSAATEASVAARRHAKHEGMAQELREAGWVAMSPAEIANYVKRGGLAADFLLIYTEPA